MACIQVIQLLHAQYFLLLLSVIRTVMAIWFDELLGSAFGFFYSSSVFVITAVIWQCYFANTLVSVKDFRNSWAFFTARHQTLSLSLGVPAIVCAPFFVANGLLKFTQGLPPSVPMLTLGCFPALLWTIPVATNSAIGLFRAANVAQLKQMQEVVVVHLVSLALYCAFLMNSEGDTSVGTSGIAVVSMLGLAVVGFVLQYVYMEPQRRHGRRNRDVQVDCPVTAPPYRPPRLPHVHTEQAPILQYQTVMKFSFQVTQFIRSPYFVMLISLTRTVMAVWFSGELGNNLNFIYTCSEFLLTAVIWQCYFANTLVSIRGFTYYWEFLTPKQRMVSLSLGVPAVLCALYFVANGLLEFTDGLPPTVPIRVLNFLPAILWTIPVVLNSALGLFQVANAAQLKQMQEVFIAHLVTLPLYCAFLMNSEGDTSVGSSGIAVLSMLGLAVVGFALQLLYMYKMSHIQAIAIVEMEEQSSFPSELLLPAIATHKVSAGDELVTIPPYNPPNLPDGDELVIHSDKPPPLRRIPDAVCRSAICARAHSFVHQ